MKVWSDSFADGSRVPERCAFGTHDPESHVALAGNKNPHLAWSDLPEGTRSVAILCVDPDVPSVGDDVNQEGKTVSASLPRVDFFHWVHVDQDPSVGALPEGSLSEGVTARGKGGPEAPGGARHGTNNYTQWFGGDADMGGDYFGYDGPCPPWNDEIVHHYVFTVYALDVERLALEGSFDGAAVQAALEGHVLGSASVTGTYAINPDAA